MPRKITPTDFQTHADKLATIKGSFKQEAARIKSDASLSPAGQQASMASSWLATAREIDAEIEAFDRRVTQRTAELQRSLYGPPVGSSQVEYRDALDRAERCESPAAAKALYDRAQLMGDVSLARAVAAIGTERGWSDITSQYFTGFSGEDGRELVEISDMQNDFNFQLTRGYAQQESPVELEGLNRLQMQALADA